MVVMRTGLIGSEDDQRSYHSLNLANKQFIIRTNDGSMSRQKLTEKSGSKSPYIINIPPITKQPHMLEIIVDMGAEIITEMDRDDKLSKDDTKKWKEDEDVNPGHRD